MSDLQLNGKRVIVTGAAGGLGRAFCESLAAAGAKVVAADIDEAGAAQTAKDICANGDTCISGGVDVASGESCDALIAQVVNAFGGVDVLVNNAALYGTLNRAPFEQLEDAEWDRVLSVNVKGVWNMTRVASNALKASGSGSIINIASATVYSGSPEWMHYVASKGAVIAMTRVMAKELGGDNVRANVIAPGITLTEASMTLMDDAKTYGASRAALKRNGEVDDICGGVLYLASDLSKYTSGQTLVIDGGKQFI
ncbi:SDR family NAD(P)-dependent oxidoreductase [Planktotalea sp.]|uniref:SDR family NAD(P)-dependent oxidoreductase n=1 Tax=Planktotalea sp. TaxID=2029877 RepID=UPI003D6B1F59